MGPYPAVEFWIDLNVRNLISWAQNTDAGEEEIFYDYAASLYNLLSGPDQVETLFKTLREIAFLSAHGVCWATTHSSINLLICSRQEVGILVAVTVSYSVISIESLRPVKSMIY